ncbi:MAG: PH domain-containing protein [Anaerolineales bacterium]
MSENLEIADMNFRPSRSRGMIFGFMILLLLLGAGVFGLIMLATDTISVWMVLWALLPLLSFPLSMVVSYRLYGLMAARYYLDRDGFFLQWGSVIEQIPIAAIKAVDTAEALGVELKARGVLAWPGLVIGECEDEKVGRVEFFASTSADRLVVVQTTERSLAISPQDREGFLSAFNSALRMGPLETIPAISKRPRFVQMVFELDRVARLLVVAGVLLPLLLLGYLGLHVVDLPPEVPFGFGPEGFINTFAPPGRLLMLPMIGGLCWLIDLVAGFWLYRSEKNRPLAYALWATPILVGGLLWGAALELLSAI